MSGMRKVVVLATALVALAAVGTAVAPKEDTAAEARLAATLAGNVKDAFGTDDWYPVLRQSGGLPSIQVVAATAFVFTRIDSTALGKSNAVPICHNVAAVTNDPNTAAPLGIRHVKVEGGPGQGNEELASCDVP
ncbi:MAG: hypothetical protein NVS9B8_16490 [Candidatus Limnocylindrales bacterium]